MVDICGVLTDSPDAGSYWRKLKQRLNEEGSEAVTFCHGLKLEASDGKRYETDCTNAEGIFCCQSTRWEVSSLSKLRSSAKESFGVKAKQKCN